MIRTKNFKRASTLAVFFNRPENKTLTLLGTTRENADEIIAIYQDPAPTGGLESERRAILSRRLEDYMAYSHETKEKLLYPRLIWDFPVAPLARVSNSLRNLKAFVGLTPGELSGWVSDNLPDGYQLLARPVAKEEYGADFALIEKT